MTKLTLVVLAAGLSSRYGGTPKQTDAMGPHGEMLLDYAVFDALQAGFSRVIFVVRREAEAAFRARVVTRLERHLAVDLAFQDLNDVPGGVRVPAARVKPWGAGHAVLAARALIREPFGVINADDMYGRGSYRLLAQMLQDGASGCLVGFPLAATLSAHGAVSRGVCHLGPQGGLARIEELTHLIATADGIVHDAPGQGLRRLDGRETVSMNMWGFAPEVIDGLWAAFGRFLAAQGETTGAEFVIPAGVDDLVRAGQLTVRVAQSPERWFGVTYAQDKPAVQAALAELVARGVYPAPLWG